MPQFDTLIIDGDSLLYRCGYAAKDEPIENALHSFKLQVQSIEEAVQCPLYRMYIKGEGNFRNELAVTKKYKGNRTTPPPENYEQLKEYAMKYQRAVEVNGMEADDMCSYVLYQDFLRQQTESRMVLAAMDKDLWNTPGWHYNYHPNKLTLEFVNRRDAALNFIRQLLTGDSSDNIPGLPAIVTKENGEYFTKRCGPKTAEKFLEGQKPKEALKSVWKAYQAYGEYLNDKCYVWTHGQALEYFTEQGRLLWMTRELTEDGNPVLWDPPAYLFE